MEDGHGQRLGVDDAVLEVLVPDRVERLGLAGALGDVGVVHVDAHVRVQQLVVLAEAARAVRGAQLPGFAQLDADGSREHRALDG